jgi:hypothetical protein
MYIAILLSVLLPSAMSIDPSCFVQQTSSTGDAVFSFQHKTTKGNVSENYSKIQRSNDVHFQLVKYSNDKYGHYVSFSDSNQTRFFNNGTLKSLVYSNVYCVSSSYKPKDLSKLWVKSFTGVEPLSLEANETSKNFTASVTLKCQDAYCFTYDFETQQYSDCYNTTAFPSVVGIKANFSLSPTTSSYAYDSACFYAYSYTNNTASCTYPYVNGYGYSYNTLNATLHGIQFNSKPNKVKSLLRPNYLKSSSGSANANSQYFSVCGEECQLLPIA